MHSQIISQILRLKEGDAIPRERGRDFEDLIREIPVWDTKPEYKPRSRKTNIDQLDAFFTHGGISFLIEAKAIEKPLTAGSNDWKSYKDKISTRSKLGVIGIFASLYPVDESLIQNSELLNNTGIHNFVLSGEFWEELLESNLELTDILDYMVHEVRVNQKSRPSNLKKLEKRILDRDSLKGKVFAKIKRINSEFLNRFEHDKHNEIYVDRSIDINLKKYIKSFRPSRLSKRTATPYQYYLIRDDSGAGKTTFSVNLSRLENECMPLVMSASSDNIDKVVNRLLGDEEIGGFLKSTIIIDQPLVLIIDSLDEVRNVAQKSLELKALFKTIESYNSLALKEGYSKFPIIVYFTIRDEYFDQWDTYFEGREYLSIRKKISSFSNDQLLEAISKYQETYRYNITNFNSLDSASKQVLSIPINLEIFSNANKNLGAIEISEVWESKILHDFFFHKKQSLYKRPLGVNHEEYFFPLLMEVASFMLLQKRDWLDRESFDNIINQLDPRLQFYSGQFWLAMISEHLFTLPYSETRTIHFRYKRAWEYLIARKVSQLIKKNDGIEQAYNLVKLCLDIPGLSIYRVIDILDFLIPKLEINSARLELFKTQIVSNEGFISRHLIHQRYLVSQGYKTSSENLKLAVLGASMLDSGRVIWDTFFLLAAKNNQTPRDQVLDFFGLAWKTNTQDKYKLLLKMSSLGLLNSEEVLLRVVFSNQSKIWETYLGACIDSTNYREEFLEICEELDILNKVRQWKFNNSKDDWTQVDFLLKILLSESEFIPGIVDNESISQSNNAEVINSDLIQGLKENFEEVYSIGFIRQGLNLKKLLISIEEERLLLEHIGDMCEKDGKPVQTSIFDFLIKSNNSGAIQFMLETGIVHLTKGNIDIFIKALPELPDSLFFMFLSNGFYELQKLKDYLNTECDKAFEHSNNPQTKGKILLTKYSTGLNNESDVVRLLELDRQILSIASIEHGYPIGSGFKNLISVVNNALSHYGDFKFYIFQATKVYGHHEELMQRDSYAKRYMNYLDNKSDQLYDHDSVLQQLFPKLTP